MFTYLFYYLKFLEFICEYTDFLIDFGNGSGTWVSNPCNILPHLTLVYPTNNSQISYRKMIFIAFLH